MTLVVVGLTVAVAVHPVVTVEVQVGMTQPLGQVGHDEVVVYFVDVVGQQSVLVRIKKEGCG